MTQHMPSAGGRSSDKLEFANTFQTPNLLVDRLLPLLRDPELRVMLYIIRRTLGFLKRQDRISVSQLVSGIVTEEGYQLDYGAGISEDAAKEALKALTAFGILLRTKPHVASEWLPPEWEVNWHGVIDWEALEARATVKSAKKETKNDKLRALQAIKKSIGAESHGAMTVTEGNSTTRNLPPQGSSEPPTPSPVGNPPPPGEFGTPLQNTVITTDKSVDTATAVSVLLSPSSLEETKKGKSPKPKGKKAKAETPKKEATPEELELKRKVEAVVAAYFEAMRAGVPEKGLPGHMPGKKDYGRAYREAMDVVADDITPEQVKVVYKHLKSDPFWRVRPLPMITVHRNIGAYYAGNQTGSHAETPNQPQPNSLAEPSHTPGVASRTERPAYAYRPKSASDNMPAL